MFSCSRDAQLGYVLGVPGPSLSVAGELQGACAPILHRSVERILADDPSSDVLIDVSGLRFLASSCLAVLTGVATDLDKKGRRLILANPQPKVRQVIRLLGPQPGFYVFPYDTELPDEATVFNDRAIDPALAQSIITSLFNLGFGLSGLHTLIENEGARQRLFSSIAELDGIIRGVRDALISHPELLTGDVAC